MHLPSYVDHFTYKNTLCIITDYCENGDLYQFLQATKQQQGHAQLPEAQVQHAASHSYSCCTDIGIMWTAAGNCQSQRRSSRCSKTGACVPQLHSGWLVQWELIDFKGQACRLLWLR